MKRLFVANLTYHEVSEADLTELFSPYGELKDVFLIRNRETDISRGIAFVEFRNDQDAEFAMKSLDGIEFHGRKIQIRPANERIKHA